jgi:hypothetical protein
LISEVIEEPVEHKIETPTDNVNKEQLQHTITTPTLPISNNLINITD